MFKMNSLKKENRELKHKVFELERKINMMEWDRIMAEQFRLIEEAQGYLDEMINRNQQQIDLSDEILLVIKEIKGDRY